ncbi:hypothetical protein JOD54_002170 [Actinokineospora baliensis]|uniref:DUF4082 domain-containing protein n=1 Tax=Actinokineospora baliensis TaxID=547056 RepID=UPI0019578294|nr:DUF4082 domain-containing protein [Actinokineospora baliensis]MBM7771966.1 hypothetical protein [Actinokineospora baliensis]
MASWGEDASLIAPEQPTAASSSDHGAISLGTRMTSTTAGRITAVLWYCPAGWQAAGTVYASVYRSPSDRAAHVALPAPIPGAWNRVALPAPVELPAASSWTVAVWLPARASGGDYAYTPAKLGGPVVRGDLTGTGGAFDYSIGAVFPSNGTPTWFGVDVVWQAAVTDPTTIPPGFPTQSTTGPAPGTTFTTYAGPTTIPPGSYLGMRFPELPPRGFYDSNAADLIFRDCEFNSGLVLRGDRLTMERTRIAGGLSLSGVDTALLRLIDVHHSGTDLLHITSDSGQCSDITISDSVFRNPVPIEDAHSDGLQVRGVRGLTIRHCSFDMGPWVLVAGKDTLNSCVFLQNAQGGNHDVRIEDTYLDGAGFALVVDVVHGRLILKGNRWGVQDHHGPVSLTGAVPTLAQDNRRYVSGTLVIPDTLGVDDLSITWTPLRPQWTFDVKDF